MRLSQTNEQIRALSEFQNHCEIEEITLQACTATRAKVGTELKEPLSIQPALSNISAHLESDRFVVEVSFEYAAWDSSEPRERAFFVTGVFEASYKMLDDYTPTNEEKTSFARGTAVFNCWPYAREFFRDITSRIGHQAPLLPLLRITPAKTESRSAVQPEDPSLTCPTPATLESGENINS